MADDLAPEAWWQEMLSGNLSGLPLRNMRKIFGRLPGSARCKFCNGPFDGRWSAVMRLVGVRPSRLTAQFCHNCQIRATEHLGGAEVKLTLLFADVRGSTQLGELLSPAEFSQLISRFLSVSAGVLLSSGAWVDRLVGDQVIGMFLPAFVGSPEESQAIDAARNLLDKIGYSGPEGPWIQIGIGIHSGIAFVGTVGSREGATDITVLGDVPNVAARLSSAAASGEILISDHAYTEARIGLKLELRSLKLKGKSDRLSAHVLRLP